MPLQLPTRLYHGHVARVVRLNCTLVDLDLGFGLVVRKNLIVEGIDAAEVPYDRRKDAMHCLVLILGGRNVLVHTDDSTLDGCLKARLYLADEVPHAPEGTVCRPFGLDNAARMEVGLMWNWVRSQNYDAREVGRKMHDVPRGE